MHEREPFSHFWWNLDYAITIPADENREQAVNVTCCLQDITE